MFGMPFSAALSTCRRLHLIQPHVNYALSIRIPVSPLHLPVRFEEYIVGILFTLISAFLRRLHLPEHQADELTTAEDLLTDESRTAVVLFTDETATADELLSDEADELIKFHPL